MFGNIRHQESQEELEDAHAWFYAAFRDAAEKLKAGIRDVCIRSAAGRQNLQPPPLQRL